MASAFPQLSGDARRHFTTNNTRLENRQPMNRPTPCKNGPLCRKYQEGTCPYNHDFSGLSMDGNNASKKAFNVESPAFTPKSPNLGIAETQQPRPTAIIANAVSAAAFTPRGSGTVTPASGSQSKQTPHEFIPQQSFQPQQTFQDFVPQNFVAPGQDSTHNIPQIDNYGDPFLTNSSIHGVDLSQQTINPYAEQSAVASGQYYTDAVQYRHPLNYHLYASTAPRREQMLPYQRATSDFFIPDALREELQRKAEATLQVFSNSTLPQNVDNHFHSLVALDSTQQRTTITFGYHSWIYKATSSVDGNVYALRRIEGFRLTTEHAINTKHQWKRITNGSIVQIYDAFTTQAFGDRSLIVVTDYFPQSQTIHEKYFARHTPASRTNAVPQEQELWGIIVQVANAIKVIHGAGLAARSITATKVLVTSKNRVRLSGCAVLDILQFDQNHAIQDLQRADLQDLGKLMLDIAARNSNAHNNCSKSLDLISKTYSEKFRACVQWLLNEGALSAQETSNFNIHTLLANIADQVINTFDSALSQDDDLTGNLMKELENGRISRLLMKLNAILERPEPNSTASTTSPVNQQPSNAWSETGERYYLKLFRDYVFHQVDHDGRPVLDLGHIVTCLNKLDAGIDEKIQLVSRDEQNMFVVSFKEVKRGFEAAWTELVRTANVTRR